MPMEGDLYLFSLSDARILLLAKHHIGALEVADESIEGADLALHCRINVVGDVDLAASDGDLHGVPPSFRSPAPHGRPILGAARPPDYHSHGPDTPPGRPWRSPVMPV